MSADKPVSLAERIAKSCSYKLVNGAGEFYHPGDCTQPIHALEAEARLLERNLQGAEYDAGLERAESQELRKRVEALEASRDGWRRDAKERMGALRREFEVHLAGERTRIEALVEVLRSAPEMSETFVLRRVRYKAWLAKRAAALAEMKP